MAQQRWIASLTLLVALAIGGCGRSGRGTVELLCSSSQRPWLTARVAIGPEPSGQTVIVVRYPSQKPITFQVADKSSTYYSASELGVPKSAEPTSLYLDLTTSTLIETFRTSKLSRDVRLKRCDGKIDAKACRMALMKLVPGPAQDIQDCDNPSSGECEAWRKGSGITSEVRLTCR